MAVAAPLVTDDHCGSRLVVFILPTTDQPNVITCHVTVTVTVMAILFKCPKNKRPRGLPLDIRLQLHLECEREREPQQRRERDQLWYSPPGAVGRCQCHCGTAGVPLALRVTWANVEPQASD